jgi:hypothetical protein
MSGFGMNAARDTKSKTAGFRDHLIKPFLIENSEYRLRKSLTRCQRKGCPEATQKLRSAEKLQADRPRFTTRRLAC